MRTPFLLRVSDLAPQVRVWIGQRVTVTLTAMTPVRFVEPPCWPELVAAQGRIVVVPEATTVPGTERVGGESYAALQRSYRSFPPRQAALVLAPIRMSVARRRRRTGSRWSAEAATRQTRDRRPRAAGRHRSRRASSWRRPRDRRRATEGEAARCMSATR